MAYAMSGAITAGALKAVIPTCVKKSRQALLKLSCRMIRRGCAEAALPICAATAPAAPPPKHTLPSAPTPRIDRSGPPVTMLPAATLISSAPSAGQFSRLPVPSAAPVSIMPPPPPPEPGVPTWLWIAGGVVALGAGAFVYSRKKGT